MPVLHNVLSNRNAHLRDSNIILYEETHKYKINTDLDSEYTSVTTWIDEQIEKFNTDKVINNMFQSKKWREGHKYWGMTSDEIKNLWEKNRVASTTAGKDLHYEIECFYNDKRFTFEYSNKELYEIYSSDNKKTHSSKPVEWQYFINFINDYHHLKPYRTEWMIYDESIKIAGSIDMIYENPDGTLSIYDWKRSKEINRQHDFNKFFASPLISHLPDTNYWHYALQLNIYKYILERNYNKKIKDLFLVRLHPDAINYELIELPDLSIEIEDLVEERRTLHLMDFTI